MYASCLTLLLLSPSAADPVPIKVRFAGVFSTEREKDLRALLKEWPEIELKSFDFESAEAELRVDAEKLFGKVKPADLIARLDGHLRQATQHTMGVKAPCEVPREKLKRVEIGVVGLDCKACCLALYEAVAKIDGVERATASFKDGTVTALIDPTKCDRAKLADAIVKRGVALKP